MVRRKRSIAWNLENVARSRKLRRERTAHGLCLDCGRLARVKRTRCVECTDYRKRMDSAGRYALYKYDIHAEEYQRLRIEQDNKCKLCRIPLDYSKRNKVAIPHIDHAHGCLNSSNHRFKGYPGGCVECVRGIVCNMCNMIDLPFLERHPERQTEVERMYLADRPIRRYRAVIA